MSKRPVALVSALLAAAVLAFIIVGKVAGPKTGEGGDEIVADMAVHVGRIERATLHQFVTIYGTVQPEPAVPGRPPAGAEVASPVAGNLSRIECVEGQKVAKGKTLFRLDSRIADISLSKAIKAEAFARGNFDRQGKLLAAEGTSQKNYLEASQQLSAARSERAAAEADLALLRISSPLTGTVIEINRRPGEAVELNTMLARVVDLDRLVAMVNVPSREVVLLRVGQMAKFEGGAAGAVNFIGVRIDDRTDTVPVRISVPPSARFRPGQFVAASIACVEHAGCLAVPETAVVSDFAGSDTGFLVLVKGDQAVRRSIRIGLREAGLAEVAGDDLKEGLLIVTEDAYAVPDGTKIHILK